MAQKIHDLHVPGLTNAELDAVETLHKRGVTVDEAAKMNLAHLDPYPIGQRLFPIAHSLDERNVRNLYEKIEARAKARA